MKTLQDIIKFKTESKNNPNLNSYSIKFKFELLLMQYMLNCIDLLNEYLYIQHINEKIVKSNIIKKDVVNT